MSRTHKGSKGPGYEYWSKRHPRSDDLPVGKVGKKLTHRYERRQANDEVKEIADAVGDNWVEDPYVFSCLHPNPENWQGDLRNG